LTKEADPSFSPSREINDKYDSQNEENNFYDSVIIAKLSEMRY